MSDNTYIFPYDIRCRPWYNETKAFDGKFQINFKLFFNKKYNKKV